ncbi:MAG: hypothetical protein LUQ33_02165 [Methanoregulaceae archaeon]|nr:hypothetical protein [Methanoregulaceae archaeon]
MAVTIRLFLGKGDAVIVHAPVILSEDAESSAEQVLSRAVREFSPRKD